MGWHVKSLTKSKVTDLFLTNKENERINTHSRNRKLSAKNSPKHSPYSIGSRVNSRIHRLLRITGAQWELKEKNHQRFCKRTSTISKCDYETKLSFNTKCFIIDEASVDNLWCVECLETHVCSHVFGCLCNDSNKEDKKSSSLLPFFSRTPMKLSDCFRGDWLFVQLLRSRLIAITRNQLIYLIKANYLSLLFAVSFIVWSSWTVNAMSGLMMKCGHLQTAQWDMLESLMKVTNRINLGDDHSRFPHWDFGQAKPRGGK